MGAILVIGASGVLGDRICDALVQHRNLQVTRGSRSATVEDARQVDVTCRSSVEAAIDDIDLVVNVVSQREPIVQRACAAKGIPCVDVTPDGQLRNQVNNELTSAPAPLVMMCGFYPGLSGILGAHVARELDEVYQLKIGLLQNDNANVGPAGVDDMLQTVSQPVPVGNVQLPGFSQKTRMNFGPTTSVVRRVNYAEAEALIQHLEIRDIRYYTAWSSNSFTLAIVTMQKLKILPMLLRSPLNIKPRHNPRRPEAVWLTAEVTGVSGGLPATRRLSIKARSDYGATALFTVAVAEYVLNHKDSVAGVLNPFEFMTLDDLQGILSPGELELFG